MNLWKLCLLMTVIGMVTLLCVVATYSHEAPSVAVPEDPVGSIAPGGGYGIVPEVALNEWWVPVNHHQEFGVGSLSDKDTHGDIEYGLELVADSFDMTNEGENAIRWTIAAGDWDPSNMGTPRTWIAPSRPGNEPLNGTTLIWTLALDVNDEAINHGTESDANFGAWFTHLDWVHVIAAGPDSEESQVAGTVICPPGWNGGGKAYYVTIKHSQVPGLDWDCATAWQGRHNQVTEAVSLYSSTCDGWDAAAGICRGYEDSTEESGEGNCEEVPMAGKCEGNSSWHIGHEPDIGDEPGEPDGPPNTPGHNQWGMDGHYSCTKNPKRIVNCSVICDQRMRMNDQPPTFYYNFRQITRTFDQNGNVTITLSN